MKVLVTGATGLLGNNAVRVLLAEGCAVRVLVRRPADDRPFAGLDVERLAGDVTDAPSVRRAVVGCDAVIHSAALVRIGWTGLAEARAVNVEGTRHVAAAALAAGLPLVHVSTVNVLGFGRPDRPADEERSAGPNIACPYVVSKREADEVVAEYAARGLRAVTIHPGLMFGPWDWKPSSGRMFLAAAGPLAFWAPPGGTSVCDVRDVAAGLVTALRRERWGARYVLAGENVTYLDLWRRMARHAGRFGPWIPAGPLLRLLGGRGGDLWGRLTGAEPELNTAATTISRRHHYFRSDRAAAELDYRSRPLDESLADAWRWLGEAGLRRRSSLVG